MGFQIYQNTSPSNNAIIQQTAAGQFLRLITNGGQLSVEADYVQFRNSANSSTTAQFDADGATNLFHNSNLKFFTKTDGAGVIGILTANTVCAQRYGGDVECNVIMGNQAGIAITPATTDVCGTVLIGCCAGLRICKGGSAAVMIGRNAGEKMICSEGSVFIGQCAGCDAVSGQDNILIGRAAGAGSTVDKTRNNIGQGFNRNVFLGNYAGRANRSCCSVMIGALTGQCSKGGQNVYLGSYAARGSILNTCGDATSDSFNVAIGAFAASGMKGGTHNIFLGRGAGLSLIHI